MSEELFRCGYGAILECDKEVLEACLVYLWDSKKSPQTFRILEIGMHDGGTARGIETLLKNNGIVLDYTGIDPDDGSTRSRHVPAGGKVIVGDSAEVFHQVSGEFDLVWVDGCHCENHVVLDTLHFAPRVRVGGFICYHDVNPRGQMRPDTGHQYCGPEGVPEFGIAVDAALLAVGFPWSGHQHEHGTAERFGVWSKFMEKLPLDPARIDCGTRAYRRIA